jgi:ubiquinone/menaquinone biosynthesis C-methylase UbiE
MTTTDDLWIGWPDLERMFRDEVAPSVATFLDRGTPHYEASLAFALGRLDEGRRVGSFFRQQQPGRPLRILDIGSGNGGVSLGAANQREMRVHALDIVPNFVLRALRLRSGIPLTQVVGSGHALPYAAESFDIVLCLETLEHIPNPPALGGEIMRVLEKGGVCMIMTPARVKHLLRPDPHYGVRGLLLLPDRLQRYVVTRILKRVAPRHYDVEHTFWTLSGMRKLFPGAASAVPLFNVPRPDRWLWWKFRNLLWDRVLIQK